MSRASLDFAAAWTAACAALAAFLAWTGLPVWPAILIAFTAGAVFTAGGAAILLAVAAVIEWRQPADVPEAIRVQLQQAACWRCRRTDLVTGFPCTCDTDCYSANCLAWAAPGLPAPGTRAAAALPGEDGSHE